MDVLAAQQILKGPIKTELVTLNAIDNAPAVASLFTMEFKHPLWLMLKSKFRCYFAPYPDLKLADLIAAISLVTPDLFHYKALQVGVEQEFNIENNQCGRLYQDCDGPKVRVAISTNHLAFSRALSDVFG